MRTVKPSSAARAYARNSKVVADAGAPGHVLRPDDVPVHRWRTDLVDPVLAFVVYGVPAPQGSKGFKGFRGGNPILAEQSMALEPWRRAVREMATRAVHDWTRRHRRPWVALDEAVLVSPMLTMPATDAASSRGDTYVISPPDLDKLQRGVGDALAPKPLKPNEGGEYGPAKDRVRAKLMEDRRRTAVLHDDSRIAAWDHCAKVYPATLPDSLGYSGCTIRIWRLADLDAAATAPIRHTPQGNRIMIAGDLRAWTQPATGETWPEITTRLLATPAVSEQPEGQPITITRRTLNDTDARQLLSTLLAHGPNYPIRVELAA